MPPFVFKTSPRHERAARQLDESGDFRILRRVPNIDEIWCRSAPSAPPSDRVVLSVLDTETTGLVADRDEMIEIAIVRMTISRKDGDLLDIEPPRAWLEQPTKPLTVETERVTGLTDADLVGQNFDDAAIVRTLEDTACMVAHNARFDAGFSKVRFPSMDLPWACSAADLPWAEFGSAGGKSLSALLVHAGLFSPCEHRAGPDAWALAVLLATPAPDGKTLGWHLWDRARRPTWRLYAERAPYSVRERLKAAGYRWCAKRRAWWTESEPEQLANESTWLMSVCPLIRPELVSYDWHTRHIS